MGCRAGDKMYIKFVGDRLEIADETTAEVIKASLDFEGQGV